MPQVWGWVPARQPGHWAGNRERGLCRKKGSMTPRRPAERPPGSGPAGQGRPRKACPSSPGQPVEQLGRGQDGPMGPTAFLPECHHSLAQVPEPHLW